MKIYEVHKSIYRVSSLRAGVVVLCGVILCIMCIGCRSSRSVSQISTTERHEVFDNTSATDSLDLSGSVEQADTAAVNINESSNDTIKIERDTAGRPVLIVVNHNANLQGSISDSKIYNLDFSGSHTSEYSESTGTVDNFDQKKEESKTEIDTAIPLKKIIISILLGPVILYVIYIIITHKIWPTLKKSIFSRRSNK